MSNDPHDSSYDAAHLDEERPGAEAAEASPAGAPSPSSGPDFADPTKPTSYSEPAPQTSSPTSHPYYAADEYGFEGNYQQSPYAQPQAPTGHGYAQQPGYTPGAQSPDYGYGTSGQNPQPGYGVPSPYYAGYGNGMAMSTKSKTAAGLLGIFLGGLGIHNFYLGHTGKALAQLLISVLSFGLLAFISSIWGLVEGIMILTANPNSPYGRDAQGNVLQ